MFLKLDGQFIMKKDKSDSSAVLLRGKISSFERSRRSHDFLMTKVQHQQIGATAIGASAMGMGAASIGLIGMAGNSDEEADWVEFEIDGKKIQGWLWMMPMRNGDNVEVVAEKLGHDRYVAYAVKRDKDDLLAVYPHATAGRRVHYRKSLKAWMWWVAIGHLFILLSFIMQLGWRVILEPDMHFAFSLIFPICSTMCAVIALRVSLKLMPFVEIAEIIFKTFGWSDIKNIDLRKTSKENRRENTLPNFGTFYFRYK